MFTTMIFTTNISSFNVMGQEALKSLNGTMPDFVPPSESERESPPAPSNDSGIAVIFVNQTGDKKTTEGENQTQTGEEQTTEGENQTQTSEKVKSTTQDKFGNEGVLDNNIISDGGVAEFACEGLKCTCQGDADCNDMFEAGVCGDIASCNDDTGECSCLIG